MPVETPPYMNKGIVEEPEDPARKLSKQFVLADHMSREQLITLHRWPNHIRPTTAFGGCRNPNQTMTGQGKGVEAWWREGRGEYEWEREAETVNWRRQLFSYPIHVERGLFFFRKHLHFHKYAIIT